MFADWNLENISFVHLKMQNSKKLLKIIMQVPEDFKTVLNVFLLKVTVLIQSTAATVGKCTHVKVCGHMWTNM